MRSVTVVALFEHSIDRRLDDPSRQALARTLAREAVSRGRRVGDQDDGASSLLSETVEDEVEADLEGAHLAVGPVAHVLVAMRGEMRVFVPGDCLP